ncbi:MAG TPA: anthranilate phosphoribosyltransferase [Fimbriimonadaceae bacterium]|nr:anthranilate phosphoribosyltransferase [Fimbriimonadaceae bacterium]
MTRDTLEALITGKHLSYDEADALMRQILESEDAVKVTATLMALRAKGCTGEELAGFARVLRSQVVSVTNVPAGSVDTCGTGGGRSTFNVSTASAIVAAAAGVPITKHGNRAVTSACGSADVLEALGIPLNLTPEQQSTRLQSHGIAFLFAPAHHPGMAKVGPIRRALGIRTVFNQLGPLANPAGCKRQVIGVYDSSFLKPMAEALRLLGAERALVVHGQEGLDEVSPSGPTSVARLEDGVVHEENITPSALGLEPLPADALSAGESPQENGTILLEALSSPDSLRALAILPSAGAAIWLGDRADTWKEGVEVARDTIASGKAKAKLEALVGESS